MLGCPLVTTTIPLSGKFFDSPLSPQMGTFSALQPTCYRSALPPCEPSQGNCVHGGLCTAQGCVVCGWSAARSALGQSWAPDLSLTQWARVWLPDKTPLSFHLHNHSPRPVVPPFAKYAGPSSLLFPSPGTQVLPSQPHLSCWEK